MSAILWHFKGKPALVSRLKNYRLRGAADPQSCHLLFEVNLELHDVRSGFRDTEMKLYSAPPLDDPLLDWTPDLVREVDKDELQELEPPHQANWPDQGDAQMIRFLLKHYDKAIWRNREADLYSQPGESREEFIGRCRQELSMESLERMQGIRDIFLRRFLDLEVRIRKSLESDDWEDRVVEQKEAEVRDVFSEIREKFSSCFLRGDFDLLEPSDLEWQGTLSIDWSERVESLRDEFITRYNEAILSLRDASERVERHLVPVSHSQIQIVTRAFLWQPLQSTSRETESDPSV